MEINNLNENTTKEITNNKNISNHYAQLVNVTIDEIPEAIQRYLATIFRLHNSNNGKKLQNHVKNQDIALALNIKASSVSKMLRKMNEMGLVDYTKNKTIFLTEIGKKISQKIINYHKCLELLMYYCLGMENEEIIHSVAQKIQFPYNETFHRAIKSRIEIYRHNQGETPSQKEIIETITDILI